MYKSDLITALVNSAALIERFKNENKADVKLEITQDNLIIKAKRYTRVGVRRNDMSIAWCHIDTAIDKTFYIEQHIKSTVGELIDVIGG